jgi:hypothetical protein
LRQRRNEQEKKNESDKRRERGGMNRDRKDEGKGKLTSNNFN